MRALAFFIPLLMFSYAHAQHPRAQKYFDAGISEYELHNYVKADTLFSWAIRTQATKEAYYNRALCRLNMGNKKGYCIDLMYATKLGDNVEELYFKDCAKADTSYLDKKLLPVGKDDYVYKEISYSNFYNEIERIYVHDKQDKVIAKYKFMDTLGNVYSYSTTNPKFHQNENERYWYMSKNLKYPKEFYKRNKNYGVALSFILNEDGTKSRVTLVHFKNDSCKVCDDEAINYLQILPVDPGKFNEKRVKFSCSYYVRFDKDHAMRDD
jgi:hypothetical protein